MTTYSYGAVDNSTATYDDNDDYWEQRCKATMDYVKLVRTVHSFPGFTRVLVTHSPHAVGGPVA